MWENNGYRTTYKLLNTTPLIINPPPQSAAACSMGDADLDVPFTAATGLLSRAGLRLYGVRDRDLDR
jgi:hypothetical protein